MMIYISLCYRASRSTSPADAHIKRANQRITRHLSLKNLICSWVEIFAQLKNPPQPTMLCDLVKTGYEPSLVIGGKAPLSRWCGCSSSSL